MNDSFVVTLSGINLTSKEMKRELKFRIWDTQEKNYYEPTHEAYKGNLKELMIGLGGDLLMHTMTGVSHESTFPDRYVIEQYTGLKDKNGNDIYEFDELTGKNGLKYKVEFIGGSFIKYEGGVTTPLQDSLLWLECEITGNIHES